MTAIINGFDKPSNSHKIEYVRIISSSNQVYDVTDLFLTFVLFEDLRGNSIDGEIVFVDSNNILSNIPIQGREELHISFSSRDIDGKFFKNYEKKFIISSAANYKRDPISNVTTVMFSIIQKAYFKNIVKKISKSFDDVPNNIVSSLCETVNIVPSTEECLFRRKFVVPNVTPFEFINFLAEESTSKQNKSTDFCFFENKDGYHFKSVYTLMQEPAKYNLTFNIENYGANTIDFDIYNVDEFICDQPFNIIEQNDGALGSTMYTHDSIKKKQIKNTLNYYTYLDAFGSMNNGGLYIDNTLEQSNDAKVLYDISDTIYANNNDDTINHTLKKLMNRTLLESSPSTFVLAGNVNIKTGDTFNFEYRIDNELDIFKSGKYLIEKIKHEVSREDYTMTVSGIKDSNIKTSKRL